MKLSENVKPISYLKAHASEVIRNTTENRQTMIITHNGEAKVVLQDIKSYEEQQESLALLKILALSTKNLNDGNFRPAEDIFSDLDSEFEGDSF